jgi:hypothetical protein
VKTQLESRTASGPQRTSSTSLREELTKYLPLKDRKKTDKSPQKPGKTKTKLLLKYQHQDWMLKE